MEGQLKKRLSRRLPPLDIPQVFATLSKTNHFFHKYPKKAEQFYHDISLLRSSDRNAKQLLAKKISAACRVEISILDLDNIATYVKLIEISPVNKSTVLTVPNIEKYSEWSTDVERKISRANQGFSDIEAAESPSGSPGDVGQNNSVLPSITDSMSHRKSSRSLQLLDYLDKHVPEGISSGSSMNDVLAGFINEDALQEKERDTKKQCVPKIDLTKCARPEQLLPVISKASSEPSLSSSKTNAKGRTARTSLTLSSSGMNSVAKDGVKYDKNTISDRSKILIRKLSKVESLKPEKSSGSVSMSSEKVSGREACPPPPVDVPPPPNTEHHRKKMIVRKLSRLCSRDDIDTNEKKSKSSNRKHGKSKRKSTGSDACLGSQNFEAASSNRKNANSLIRKLSKLSSREMMEENPEEKSGLLGSLRRSFNRQLSRMSSQEYPGLSPRNVVDSDSDSDFK